MLSIRMQKPYPVYADIRNCRFENWETPVLLPFPPGLHKNHQKGVPGNSDLKQTHVKPS